MLNAELNKKAYKVSFWYEVEDTTVSENPKLLMMLDAEAKLMSTQKTQMHKAQYHSIKYFLFHANLSPWTFYKNCDQRSSRNFPWRIQFLQNTVST